MNTKEFIKKFWFIGLVAIALFVFIGMYAYDTYKNREIVVSNKQIDGKYVVYSIDGEPVFADDFYEDLYASDGLSKAIIAYQRAIFDKGYETTAEMSALAANSAANIMASYSQDYIVSALQSMGYTNGIDDLTQYYVDSQKQQLLFEDYVRAHQDEYLGDALGTNGRLIYHILVMCDVEPITDEEGNVTGYEAKPTDEQKARLDEVLEFLKDENNTFEYAAYTYSEDTGSAQNGGYIGVVNEENAAMYDQTFAKRSLELKDGEVSEPVVSAYGYHIIKSAGSTADALISDHYFINDLQSNNPDIGVKAVMAKGEELGFEILDETMRSQIEQQTGSEE